MTTLALTEEGSGCHQYHTWQTTQTVLRDCRHKRPPSTCLVAFGCWLLLAFVADIPVTTTAFSIQRPLCHQHHSHAHAHAHAQTTSSELSQIHTLAATKRRDDDSKDARAEGEEGGRSTTRPRRRSKPSAAVDNMERAWRHVKKPLLRVGSRGAALTHGNSLRQLLDAHTVVKVKVNTQPFDGSFENAFANLRDLAEQTGAVQGIEMIHIRESEKTILFALPGTLQRIKDGDFPPVDTDPEQAPENDEN